MKIIGMIVLIVLYLSTGTLAETTYVVIANSSIKDDVIDIPFIKKVYGGRVVLWSNQVKIDPCYISSQRSEGSFFFQNILKMPEKRFNKYWTKKVFSGNGAKPVMFKSVEDAIAYVLGNDGGIAIVPKDAAEGKGCKVVIIPELMKIL